MSTNHKRDPQYITNNHSILQSSGQPVHASVDASMRPAAERTCAWKYVLVKKKSEPKIQIYKIQHTNRTRKHKNQNT